MSPRFRNTFDLGVGELGRPEWHLHAACRGVGADQYFNGIVTPQALQRCATCPVAIECREQGERETFGAWAGHLSAGQRLPKPRKVKPVKARGVNTRKRRPVVKVPVELSPCGTHAAYTRHIRRGETPDAACAEAHSRYVAEAAKRRRRAARARRAA